MQAPSYETVLERCIQLIAKSRKIPAEEIRPDTTFEAIGADSLDMINLSFEVEELFDVEIPDEALSSIRTVADMAKGVSTLILAKPAAPLEETA